MNTKNIWFLGESESIYGDDALHQVELNIQKVDILNMSRGLPFLLLRKPLQMSSAKILKINREAEASPPRVGISCWMHTFSPVKMWSANLSVRTKSFLQLNIQFNEQNHFDMIDTDFMNLNQCIHRDSEFGYNATRIGLKWTVIAGQRNHTETQQHTRRWMFAAIITFAESKTLVVARFGDNMSDVVVINKV